MAQLVVLPMMGAGLFSGSALVAAGSLMGHLVYGAVLGAVYDHAASAHVGAAAHGHAQSAIVCASKSCPALRPEAYRAAVLERQLDDAARGFVRDTTRNRLDAAAKTLWLSSNFDWFDEDFERAAGSVPAFVARYTDEPTTRAIRDGGVRVEFLDYDWSLNGR